MKTGNRVTVLVRVAMASFVLTTACLVGSNSELGHQVTETPSATMLTPGLLPTSAGSLTASTPSALPGTSQASNNSYSVECVQVSATAADPSDLDGTVLVSDAEGALRLLDLGTSELRALTIAEQDKVASAPSASPDGSLVAYEVEGSRSSAGAASHRLDVVKPSGILERSLRWEVDWGAIEGWLGNEWVQIMPIPSNPGDVISVNVVTGDVNRAKLSLQDALEWPSVMWLPRPDPSLQRIVYMSSNLPGSGKTGPALMDVASGEVLWSGEDSFPGMHAPAWDSLGKRVAIAFTPDDPHKYELVVVSSQGGLVATTEFGGRFEQVYVGELSWSPDGASVAMWVDARDGNGDGKHEALAVLNVTSNVVTNYCINGQYEFNRSPIWSPDSTKLIIDHGEADAFAQEVLLDIGAGSAASLDVAGVVLAWLQGPGTP